MGFKHSPSGLVRVCLDYLKLRGVYAWRANTTGVWDETKKCFRTFHGLRGVADILGCLRPNGRLLAVECKAGKGRLSREQEAFLAGVQAAGGLAVVARSLADLEEALGG